MTTDLPDDAAPAVRRKKKTKEPAVPRSDLVDLRDLHWAMHAIVKARSRAAYDVMAPLPTIPKGPAVSLWGEEVKRQARWTGAVPIFTPAAVP